MLSVRVLGVRDVPCPPPGVRSKPSSSSSVLWTVQVNHGAQQHRTHFVAAPVEKKNDEGVHKETLLKDTRPAARAPWEKEVEVEDKENEETISIALLFELEANSTRGRKLFRHSIATVDMRVFRDKPEERMELWLPLRSVGSTMDEDNGAIRLAMTYTDDYTDRGDQHNCSSLLTGGREHGGVAVAAAAASAACSICKCRELRVVGGNGRKESVAAEG
eukprot:jgi/Undpi1/5730/HiC_scaffold_2.g01004.m1